MRFDHIKGLLIQEFFITVRSYEVILDIFVMPSMMIIVFGFLAMYVSGSSHASMGNGLLSGMFFWQIIFVVQYSVSVSTLWNVWSRNLSNMFVSPVSLPEYITAQIISAVFKALCILIPTSLASILIFNFNIYSLGFLNLLLFFISLTLFALSLGFIILGLILRFGTRIQAFAWGLLPIFQPFTAAFYPVSILPGPMQFVAYLLPPTYVFEAMRASVTSSQMQWHFIGISFFGDFIYFIFALWFFNKMFNKSKEVGQLARLEG